MAQIRAAFEEVRSALGLDNDTILFGVPVDQDNALGNTVTEPVNIQAEPEAAVIDEVIVQEPEVEQVEEEPEILPESSPIIDEVETTEIISEPEDIAQETESQPEQHDCETDTVIPILSILSTNEAEAEVATAEKEETVEEEMSTIAEPLQESELVIDNSDTLTVSIDDIVADEAPVVEQEKTLEELLESMKPLDEDMLVQDEAISQDSPDMADEENADFSISMTDDATDTDATLAQLANEFAQAQDKIPESPKPSSNGKIGKLKNILPFKKAKRDDSGLMGDLFGWAGIAANDEDFSIPGFFTGAVGQK